MTTNKYTPPNPDKKETLYRVVKAGLGSIPYVGAAASELLTLLMTPPLEKRRDQWMQKVGERLSSLEDDGYISLKELQKNEEFISTVMQASQTAIRTHQEEKLKILLNAIENSAMNNVPQEIYQQIFLNFIDAFTVFHIKVLHFLTGIAIGKKSGLEIVKEEFVKEGVEKFLCDHVWKDLESKGLVTDQSDNSIPFQVRRTPLGNQFIDFITSRYEK